MMLGSCNSGGTRPARFLCAFVWLVACEGAPAGDAVVVRDSAGIRIVENREPVWGETSPWRIAKG